MKAVRTILALVILCFTSAAILVAQVAEQNVNMVAGTQWPGGDPFLQRQNEGSIAVSTRNPIHLLAAANDYRTVDLPGLPDGEETGDAWVGIFKSFDAGQTWRSTLLPGYPQDRTGGASPLKDFKAAADPVVRAGRNGMLYLSGIVLNRDPNNPLGALFVSRFIDNNNLEAGDPISFLGTAVVDRGTSGQFVDKPWIAVAPAAAGSAPCTVNGQTFPAQNVYVAYTIFVPNDTKYRSKLMLARSGDCGGSWTIAKLSETFSVNQGASVAIDPTSGAVYVAWRRFAFGTDTNAILIAKSTDQGKSFSKGQVVSDINPFEQGTTSVSIRTNAYPTMAVDNAGRVYIAWSQRGVGPGGDARILMMSSTDGVTWSQPGQVDPYADRGHQFMPSIIFVGSKLLVVYYDLREDHTIGIFTPIPGTGRFAETRQRVAEDPETDKVFTPNLIDAAPAGYTRLLRRHTIDVRAAQGYGGVMASFNTARVSRYVFGSRPGYGTRLIEQLQFNPPNFPMFRLGSVPFLGDYLDVTGYVAGASGAAVYHAVWTDNRDVRPPRDGNWANYTPPSSPAVGAMSTFDPTKPVPQCVPGQSGMRNQNIYTARITEGLFAGSPSNAKPLGKIQRAFVVFVQNTNNAATTFRLTIAQQPPGGAASFAQLSLQTQIDVPVPARSSASRSVFVNSTDPRASVRIDVVEISGGVPTALTSAVVLNPDVSNPDVSNPDVSNPDVSNPDVSNAEVHNPDVSNPDVSNPDVSNPDVSNPDVSNPDVSNPDVSNPDVSNPDVSNPDVSNPDVSNPDVSNPDVSNADIVSGSVTDTNWTVKNQGNTTSGYVVKLASGQLPPAGVKTLLIINRLYRTPVARPDCTLGVQVSRQIIANISNPPITDLGQLNSITPADPTLWLAPSDTARVTLRVFNNSGIPYDAATAITPVIIGQAANTLGTTQLPTTLTVTTKSLQDAVAGRSYNATATAIGGIGAYTWTISGVTGLTIDANGAISGAPAAAGDAFVTLRVRDSAATPHVASRTMPLHVAAPLLITSSALAEAVTGLPYGPLTLTTSGGTGALKWSLNSGALPAGLTFSATGTVAGNTTAAGDYSFGVSATDSSSPAQTATATLTLRVVQPLSVVTTSFADAVVGGPYTATLAATGGYGTKTWSVTSGTLPAGLTLAADGTLAGSPTVSGQYSITFTVTDSDSPAKHADAQLALHVADPLIVTTTALPEAIIAQVFNANLTASGGTGTKTWQIASGSLPAGLSLSTTGSISGTPVSPSDSSFTISVTDSGSPAQTATRALTVRVIEALAIQTTALSDATALTPYSATLLATGGYGARSWSVTAGQLPAGLTLSPTGGLSGSPVVAGVYPVTFTVFDSDSPANSRSLSLTLVVRAVLVISTSTLPVGVSGGTINVALQASGGLAPYTWTMSATPGLTIDSVSGAVTGSVSTPGAYQVIVTVSDAQGRVASTTYQLTVVAPLSITTSSLPDGTVGQAYSATLQASGGYGARTWSIAAGALPTGLVLNAATGAVSGTPTVVADIEVTFAVSDSNTPAASVSQTFLIRTHPAPGTMVIRPTTAAAGFGQLVAIDGANLPAATSVTVSFRDSIRSINGTILPAPSTSTRLFVRLPFIGDGVTIKNLLPGNVVFTVSSGKTTLGSGQLTVAAKPGTPIISAAYSLTTAPSTDNRCGSGISNAPIQTIAFGRGLVVSAFGVDVTAAEAAWVQGSTTIIVASGCAFSNTALGVAPVFDVPSALQSGPVALQLRTTVNGVISDWSAPLNLMVH